jgi:hypothetical protein
MTALVYRVDDRHVTVIDEDDGCEPGNHRRDELCARTRVEALPADEPASVVEDDNRGGST